MSAIWDAATLSSALDLVQVSLRIAERLETDPEAAKITWFAICDRDEIREHHQSLILEIHRKFFVMNGNQTRWSVDDLLGATPPPKVCEAIDAIIAMAESSSCCEQILIDLAAKMIVCGYYCWSRYLEQFLDRVSPDQYQLPVKALAKSFSGYHRLLSEWTVCAPIRLVFLRSCQDDDHAEGIPMIVSRVPIAQSKLPAWIRIGDWYLRGVNFWCFELRLSANPHEEGFLFTLYGGPRRRYPMRPDLSANFQTVWYGANYLESAQVQLPAALNDLMTRISRSSRAKSARSAQFEQDC